ncbi:MAG: four helix bundle protein [Candidatus Dojkabacteria bacterium]|nr:four helix bundle protein [Candidatus Dojkabacteria bacterium]
MGNFLEFQDILAYKRAEKVAEEIWELVVEMDWFRKQTIGMQIIKAIDSVCANIAEGHGRFFYKEKLKFYYYSRASAQETIVWLRKSGKRKMVTYFECKTMISRIEEILKLINILIRSTRSRLK